MEKSQLTRRSFLLKLGSTAGLLGGPLLSSPLVAAAAGKLTGASLSGTDGIINITFMLSAPVEHKVFTLKAPDRVVIDLKQTTMEGNLKKGKHDRPPLQGIRYANREGGYLRIVLDLSGPVTMNSQMAKRGNAHALTVSLKATDHKAATRETSSKANKPQPAKNQTTQPSRRGNFVVVIDPGHGGHDPGAVGKKGTREKDVVLAVSRKLKSRIDSHPGMQAIMTRSDDKYVPLRKRIEIARKSNADLFISVHADANNSSRLKGSSVYILSENGASSEAARLLAQSENSYELKLGGSVQLASSNEAVNSILLDLSQNETLDRSLELAKSTLKELARVSNPLRNKVESAGFVVLKAPDIPSMLVETAFISNPLEENRLRTSAYQQKLADAMFRGVKRYQQAHGADQKSQQYVSVDDNGDTATSNADTHGAGQYIVRSGDSLSEIAEFHGVSTSTLKRFNNLRSSNIRIGQTLKIPTNT